MTDGCLRSGAHFVLPVVAADLLVVAEPRVAPLRLAALVEVHPKLQRKNISCFTKTFELHSALQRSNVDVEVMSQCQDNVVMSNVRTQVRPKLPKLQMSQ